MAFTNQFKDMEEKMAWTKPTLKEVNCGMEINMYTPADGDEREGDLF